MEHKFGKIEPVGVSREIYRVRTESGWLYYFSGLGGEKRSIGYVPDDTSNTPVAALSAHIDGLEQRVQMLEHLIAEIRSRS